MLDAKAVAAMLGISARAVYDLASLAGHLLASAAARHLS